MKPEITISEGSLSFPVFPPTDKMCIRDSQRPAQEARGMNESATLHQERTMNTNTEPLDQLVQIRDQQPARTAQGRLIGAHDH